MASLRHQRVSELIKRALGEIFRRELSISEVGLVGIHDVCLSNDIKSALIYYGVTGSEHQKKAAQRILEESAGRFQYELAQAVVLKYVPKLRFRYDDSIERGDRVLHLLDELDPPAQEK